MSSIKLHLPSRKPSSLRPSKKTGRTLYVPKTNELEGHKLSFLSKQNQIYQFYKQ
jgi:hypothetical protein